MTADAALAAYEAARHRLPAGGRAGACRRAADLDAIAGLFDAFLLDAFGVLNIGETPIPGVAARIAGLRARGKSVLVLTNAASQPAARLAAKYAALGYDFAPEEIVSSRAALLAGLPEGRDLLWGVMCAQGDGLEDLARLRHLRLADDPAAYRQIDGVILLGSADWTDRRQRLLEEALAVRPRAVLVGNPDIVAPREHGFSVEPGHYAHRLADRCGVAPRFFGKPFGNIFDLAFARLGAGAGRDRVVMVGDSLHTDVLGASAAGIASALVCGYGFLAGQDAETAMRRTGLRPDFLLERP